MMNTSMYCSIIIIRFVESTTTSSSSSSIYRKRKNTSGRGSACRMSLDQGPRMNYNKSFIVRTRAYLRWENKNKKGRSATKELRDSYFGQLSEDEVGFNKSPSLRLIQSFKVFRLFQLYESDFQAFEYELPPKYLIRVYNETASKR